MRRLLSVGGFAPALCGTVVLVSLVGCGWWGNDKTVVARVDNSEITSKEIDAAMRKARPGEPIEDLAESELGDLKKSLLSELIEEELIVGAAKGLKISVSDDELKAEVDSLKRDYDEKAFSEIILKRYDSISDWKDDVRKKLLVRKAVATVGGTSGEVTDEMVAAYYNEHIDEYLKPEQVRARMILVATRGEAEKVKKRLKTETFSTVAKNVSQSPDGSQGTEPGFFGRGDMPKEFEDVVFSLEPGRASDIVETPYGFHIFFVEARKAGSKLALSEVAEDIKSRIRQERADREFKKWMLELKSKAKIEILEAP